MAEEGEVWWNKNGMREKEREKWGNEDAMVQTKWERDGGIRVSNWILKWDNLKVQR